MDDGEQSRRGLVEPYDSDVGSARVDRGVRSGPCGADVTSGGDPSRAVLQQRPWPLEELVGTAGPDDGEPGDEHGSAGQDAGSMDGPPPGASAGGVTARAGTGTTG